MGKSQQTSTQSIPKWQSEFLQGTAFPIAQNIADQPFTPYTGQMTPEISQLTTQAGDIYGGLAGMTPEDYAARTAANFNPYQQNVIDASLAQMGRQQQQALTNLEANQIGSGAFGSRGEVARGEFEAANQAQRDALIASMMQQGYAGAHGLTQQQIANMGSAAAGLQGVGTAQTAIDAAGLQAQYDEFLRQQNYPYQQLAGVLGAAQGNYGGTTTESYRPGLFDYLTLGASGAGSYFGR
jgi:hypothetical protein